MTVSVFLDTNVLVYAYDPSELAKQKQAIILLDAIVEYQENVRAAISTQVLLEFANTVTRKTRLRFSAAEAYIQVEEFVHIWNVLSITPQTVLEAVRGMRDYGFSVWDAQIWAVARLNEIPIVLSEDFSTGSIIEGVRFINPFSATFDIATLIP